ncbi:choice-of-anchor J domain-containing protein [Chondromyces apiculatus]|nr:choice-of-anchor J domain-containing protein [Chondromyces apiculatus]
MNALAGALVTWLVAAPGCASNTEPPTGTTTTTSTSSTGGGGGEGGGGGAGGGEWTGPCDQDCSKIETAPCLKAVCNEGQVIGTIGLCAIVYDDGTTCDDGLFCTTNDTCESGQCVGGEQNDCGMETTSCHSVVCDEDSDSCSEGSDTAQNGNPCQPTDLCQTLGTCQNGTCVGLPKDCTFSPFTECNSVACNPATGQCEPTADAAKNGVSCSLTGDQCSVSKTCNNGQCQGGTTKDCSAFTAGCNVGVCNAQSGNCVAQAIPAGQTCAEGTNNCNVGICDAAGVCNPTPVADGTVCNDRNSCTGSDSCTAGTCNGMAVTGCAHYLRDNFETGCPPTGWTLAGDWECGTPSSVGPAKAYSGSVCIATQIDANYSVNQTYTTSYAQFPPISLVGATAPVLSFQTYINTEGSTYDGVNLKVSTDGGTTWTVLSTVTPAYNLTIDSQSAWGGPALTTNTWATFSANLSAYVGQNVLLRFSFRSNASVQAPGVYVDDVVVAEANVIPLRITTSRLPDAATNTPYFANLLKNGGSSAATWSIVSGTNHDWLTLNPSTGALGGTPAVANIGPFEVRVRIEEPSLPSNFDEVTLQGMVVDAVFAATFESCPNGWTLAGDWECGVPSNVGPATAYSGTGCLATQIDANYSANQAWATTIATSPAINLSGTTAPLLSFRMWLYSEMNSTATNYDAVNLKISTDGATFTPVTNTNIAYNMTAASESGWGGNQSALGWRLITADLTAYAGQTIYLRFAFRSDGTVHYPGAYIDELFVTD